MTNLKTWFFHKFLFVKIRTIIELTPAPFRFSSVQTFSHRKGAHIKKLILWKLIGVPNNIGEGVDPFPDPVGHFGPPGGHFRFCSQCGNADCEQMLPMLIGCFYPPPIFPVGTSSIMNLCLCFWVSKKYRVSPSSPLCVSPSLCPFAFLCPLVGCSVPPFIDVHAFIHYRPDILEPGPSKITVWWS